MQNWRAEALEDAAQCFPWKQAWNHCLTCYYAAKIAHRLLTATAENFWVSLNGSISMDVLEASNGVKMFREQQAKCVTTLHPIRCVHGQFFSLPTFNTFYFDRASVSYCGLPCFLLCSLRISISWQGLILFMPHWFMANPSTGPSWVINPPCTQNIVLYRAATIV